LAGGILNLTHTQFIDNGVGIYMHPVRASAMLPNKVENCDFTMQQSNPSTNYYWSIDYNQPIGILAKVSYLPNYLKDNRFISTIPATTNLNKRGIGILLGNVKASITATPNDDIEFEGLSKGIDVYNTTTVVKAVNIEEQDFNNTRKAITLNSSIGSTVINNTFHIPTGEASNDTYGIMSQNSKAINVLGNELYCNASSSSSTFGIIFNESQLTGFVSQLRNNLFDGRFSAATQFVGNNQRLSTNCNAYDDCEIDWHLNTTAILPGQGSCDGDVTLALRTHWHYTNEPGGTDFAEEKHIVNENATAPALQLNIDGSPQSNPIGEEGTEYVVGNVIVTTCVFVGASENLSCTVEFPELGAGATDCNDEADIERRIYTYLEQDNRDELLALLHCVDTEWAIRLLVGTYVDERLYEQALTELQRLSNTPENAEFVALYNAIISGGLDEQTGSGKADIALATVNEVVANKTSSQQTLAESILAVYKNSDYVRHAAPINYKKASNDLNPEFTISPNPAKNSVVLNFTQPTAHNGYVQLLDINGRLQQQVNIAANSTACTVDITTLQTGIYYCRLNNGQTTAKLVIIK
jgi:hypothetical protein